MRWLRRLASPPGAIGHKALGVIGGTGRASLFLLKAMRSVGQRPVRLSELVAQIHFIGQRSAWIILLSASFTGMVLVLQGYQTLTRFGSEAFVGPLVALSLIRELGPVLGAIMVAARAGSAITASIGSMRISEQIDALTSMAVDPLQYLVGPRLVATVVSVPLLVVAYDLAGIAAGYLFGVSVLGIDGGEFMANVRSSVEWSDVSVGLQKAGAFALIVVWVCTYQGFETRGGATGVGESTTRAVVLTTTLILAADYLMTALLF